MARGLLTCGDMPRIPRGQAPAGTILHILNRGNARATVFHTSAEFAGFARLIGLAAREFAHELYAFSLLPNHFHMVVRGTGQCTVSEMMQWCLTAHVRRYHKRHGTTGHVWQGRFKSFPVQDDLHLLTVLRYVLLNPVRAGLVSRAADWRWTSLHYPRLVSPWPVPAPKDFTAWLAVPLAERQLADLRRSVARRAPYGTSAWTEACARACGLERTLRPRGRPVTGPGEDDLALAAEQEPVRPNGKGPSAFPRTAQVLPLKSSLSPI